MCCVLCWQPESEFVDDDPDVVFERCLLDGDLGDTMELSAQHVRYYLPSLSIILTVTVTVTDRLAIADTVSFTAPHYRSLSQKMRMCAPGGSAMFHCRRAAYVRLPAERLCWQHMATR